MTLPISDEHARELARLVQHEARPDLVIIGAVALGHHLPLRRHTADVDLALVVTPTQIEPLLTSVGWRRDDRLSHRWHGPDRFRADVLSATPDLVAAGAIHLDEHTTMSLVGFDLALEHAIAVELPGTTTRVKVASLPTLVVLKMVAWLDRPYERTKDLGDLVEIFERALPEDDDRRWETTNPIGASGLDFEQQSPFAVGLDVSAIARGPHRRAIDQFISRLLDDSGIAAAQMARAAGLSHREEHVARLLDAFTLGFRGGRHAEGPDA